MHSRKRLLVIHSLTSLLLISGCAGPPTAKVASTDERLVDRKAAAAAAAEVVSLLEGEATQPEYLSPWDVERANQWSLRTAEASIESTGLRRWLLEQDVRRCEDAVATARRGLEDEVTSELDVAACEYFLAQARQMLAIENHDDDRVRAEALNKQRAAQQFSRILDILVDAGHPPDPPFLEVLTASSNRLAFAEIALAEDEASRRAAAERHFERCQWIESILVFDYHGKLHNALAAYLHADMRLHLASAAGREYVAALRTARADAARAATAEFMRFIETGAFAYWVNFELAGVWSNRLAHGELAMAETRNECIRVAREYLDRCNRLAELAALDCNASRADLAATRYWGIDAEQMLERVRRE